MYPREETAQLDRVFLREVVENPRDDTPLLVYADWLMDQPDQASQTRGEYLRLITILEHTPVAEERRDLHWRAQQLWWNHVESWLGSLYEAVDHFLYERGRLCLEISSPLFFQLGIQELQDSYAWDWVTDILVRKGSLDLLLHLGQLPRPPLLQSVDIGGQTLAPGELAFLLKEGFWMAIPELELAGNELLDSDLSALAYWTGLDGVQRLDLGTCLFGELGALALIQSPYLRQIRQIHLAGPRLRSPWRQLLVDRFGSALRLD